MSRPMSCAVVIPARYASTRLPGKPLIDLVGRSMIMRVVDQASKASAVDQVVVATDDRRILDYVQAHGGQATLTPPCDTGTARVARVARSLSADIIINVQGDEPLIDPGHIDQLAQAIAAGHPIATLCTPIESAQRLFDYHTVKVVRSQSQQALYFSRQAIPAHRDHPYSAWLEHADYFQHLGIYAFQRTVLLGLEDLPASPLAQIESLEQLQWLDAGLSIHCPVVPETSIGVDTLADAEEVRRILGNK